MRYAVVDVETTGFSPREDRVVEMACVLVERGAIVHTWSTLVNPCRPIPVYATRVHGITDSDVADAPAFEQAQRDLWRLCIGSTVAAHNASFDLGFLPALAHLPSVCTVQLARRWFPNAPNHKNQTLRAYLNIDEHLHRLCCSYPEVLEGLAAHRALADAMVTAAILIRCLEQYEHTRNARSHAG